MSLDTLLLASLSADSKTRIQAEESLSRDVSAVELMRYVKQSTDLASRLSALVYLKNYVLQHWSAQFAEYKGQLCSEEVKHVIRHDCYSLIGDSQRVVRAQAGFITSKIIAADYPEEWATVLDDLLSNLARPTSEEWLNGSLIVMKGMDYATLSNIRLRRGQYERRAILADCPKSCWLPAQHHTERPIPR